MISKKLIGERNGKEVYSFLMDNENGLKAEILTYGGIVKSLIFNGVDVVLGKDTLDEYLDNPEYLGALVGRNSNRISNSKFELNGKTYTLTPNNNLACNHGGIVGFSHKVWDYEISDEAEPSLILSLFSEDGDEGFPGNVNVKVTYTLTKENSLKINYIGSSDQDTILNMTNHSYFNLNGHSSGNIHKHTISLDCNYFNPNVIDCYPNGEILKVDGTPFDLRTPCVLEDKINSDYPQISMFNGFDHNFIINSTGYRKCATVTGDLTGITMETYTDRPSVQLYTANGLDGTKVFKDGVKYQLHQAFCLETQTFPNGINYPHFPSPVIKKGEIYNTTTEFKFSLNK